MELLSRLQPLHLVLLALVTAGGFDVLYLRRRGRPLSGSFYFCFAFGSLGAATLLLSLQALWWSFEAKSWIEAVGVVTVAESSGWSTRTDSGTSYELRYRYTVDGIEHDGWRLWPAGAAGRRALEFSVGQEVPVFYDPQRPRRAMLERTYPMSRFLTMLAVSLFVMIPAASASWSWWSHSHATVDMPRPGTR